jgi:hypothetical protein
VGTRSARPIEVSIFTAPEISPELAFSRCATSPMVILGCSVNNIVAKTRAVIRCSPWLVSNQRDLLGGVLLMVGDRTS